MCYILEKAKKITTTIEKCYKKAVTNNNLGLGVVNLPGVNQGSSIRGDHPCDFEKNPKNCM